jgi:hypothetical protein
LTLSPTPRRKHLRQAFLPTMLLRLQESLLWRPFNPHWPYQLP